VYDIRAVFQTSDGGYIYAGETNYIGAGGFDMYLAKANSNGDTTWVRTFGSAGDERQVYMSKTNDGGYLVTSQDGWVVKTDENGLVD
jgi:hypothetical protein